MSKAMSTFSFPPTSITSTRFPGQKTSFSHVKKPSSIAFALKGDANNYERKGRQNYNGKSVDDNMIVLRIRIREMEMEEKELPENWMEWEKRYYGSGDYGSDVCEGVGVLQRWLMDTTPSFALAMVALVTLSVPVSLGLIVWHLIHILSLFHVIS